MDMEENAIEILRLMCGNSGCTISDSGGKDSSVIKHIALKAQQRYGLQFSIRHNLTTVDAPETVYFVRSEQEKYRAMGIRYEMAAERMSTETAYIEGYIDAMQEIAAETSRKREMQRQREQDRKARRWYFIKQRALGLALLMLTIIAVWALDGDATIGIVTVPLGLWLTFSGNMLVVNGYYMEVKQTESEATNGDI